MVTVLSSVCVASGLKKTGPHVTSSLMCGFDWNVKIPKFIDKSRVCVEALLPFTLISEVNIKDTDTQVTDDHLKKRGYKKSTTAESAIIPFQTCYPIGQEHLEWQPMARKWSLLFSSQKIDNLCWTVASSCGTHVSRLASTVTYLPKPSACRFTDAQGHVEKDKESSSSFSFYLFELNTFHFTKEGAISHLEIKYLTPSDLILLLWMCGQSVSIAGCGLICEICQRTPRYPESGCKTPQCA